MEDPYLYSGSNTLKNKLGLRDAAELRRQETHFTAERMRDLPKVPLTPAGLKKLHRHIFQDVYSWAGKPRTINMFKAAGAEDVLTYRPAGDVDNGLNQVFGAIQNGKILRGLDKAAFADKSAEVLHEIYAIHPFREGNTRTSQALLWRMGLEAGYDLRPERNDPAQWRDAFYRGRLQGDNRPLRDLIYGSIEGQGRQGLVAGKSQAQDPPEKEELDRALAGMRASSSRGRDLAAAESDYGRIGAELSQLDARIRAGEEINRDLRNEFQRLYGNQDAALKFNTIAAQEGPEAAIAVLRTRPQRFGQVAPNYRDETARQALIGRIAEAAPAALQARADARGLDRSYQQLMAERAIAKQGLSLARRDAETGNPVEARKRLLRAWAAVPRELRAAVSSADREVIGLALREAREQRGAARVVDGNRENPGEAAPAAARGRQSAVEDRTALDALQAALGRLGERKGAQQAAHRLREDLQATQDALRILDSHRDQAEVQARSIEVRLPQVFRDPKRASEALRESVGTRGVAETARILSQRPEALGELQGRGGLLKDEARSRAISTAASIARDLPAADEARQRVAGDAVARKSHETTIAGIRARLAETKMPEGPTGSQLRTLLQAVPQAQRRELPPADRQILADQLRAVRAGERGARRDRGIER